MHKSYLVQWSRILFWAQGRDIEYWFDTKMKLKFELMLDNPLRNYWYWMVNVNDKRNWDNDPWFCWPDEDAVEFLKKEVLKL